MLCSRCLPALMGSRPGLLHKPVMLKTLKLESGCSAGGTDIHLRLFLQSSPKGRGSKVPSTLVIILTYSGLFRPGRPWDEHVIIILSDGPLQTYNSGMLREGTEVRAVTWQRCRASAIGGVRLGCESSSLFLGLLSSLCWCWSARG